MDRLRVLVRPAAADPEERQEHAVDRCNGPARRRPEHSQQQADKLLRRSELDFPGGGADIEHLQDDVEPTLGIVRRHYTRLEYGRTCDGGKGVVRGGSGRRVLTNFFLFFFLVRKRTDQHDHRDVPIRGGKPVADAGENALSVQLEGHIEST